VHARDQDESKEKSDRGYGDEYEIRSGSQTVEYILPAHKSR
jgi:hypothetical protein